MCGLCPLIALRYDRTAPLAVGIRPLVRCAVSAGVGVVSPGCSAAAVHAATANGSRAGPRRWVVPSCACHAAIRSVSSARDAVRSVVWVVHGTDAVGDGIRTINGIGMRAVIKVRRIMVPTPVGNGGAHRRSDNEHAKIARGATRLRLASRSRGLPNISYVVNGRTRRDCINFFGN